MFESFFAPLLLVGHSLLFAFGWWIGGLIYSKNKLLQKSGKKLIETKTKALQTNPVIRQFAHKVENGQLTNASVFLFFLITVKSIGMILLGFVGLSILVMPFQGSMMLAMVREMQNSDLKPDRQFYSVTISQLFAHLSLGVIGNWLGYRYFLVDNASLRLIEFDWLFPLIGLFIITAGIAAHNETRFFQRNKTLIG